ncbi:fasciclin domain-containing protein [Roseivivax isoporae]|uniref:FAS1 domain-containing protein n=1 Tax=Roseivivax isoporae LMG 25204 TaxID=1449351 RepID=X7F4X7_9RHOB|nr:fasciclin domain-containing protein [Roseivivax isoporae]ETX27104.1 hypothetical protein RISW2_16685 [Roseivivax isoporae LMG 25204]
MTTRSLTRRDALRGAAGIGALSLLPAAAQARRAQLDLLSELGTRAEYLTLMDLLVLTGLSDTLRRRGPFTVFAPREMAFWRMSQAQYDQLIDPVFRPQLARILRHHVVPERHSVFELVGRRTVLPTLAGTSLVVDGLGGNGLRAGGAPVSLSEIEATNGFAHEVDTLMRPV